MFLSGITLSAAPGLLLSRTVVLPGCTSTRNRWQLSRRQKVCGAHRGSVTDNGQYSLCFVCVQFGVCKHEKQAAGSILCQRVCENKTPKGYEGTLADIDKNVMWHTKMTKGLWYAEWSTTVSLSADINIKTTKI